MLTLSWDQIKKWLYKLNYFYFLGVSPWELFLESIMASIGVLLVAPIGFYFIAESSNEHRKNLFGALAVGLIFLSTLACVLLAFAPLLVKPMILISIVAPLPYWMFWHRKRKDFVAECIQFIRDQGLKLLWFTALVVVCVGLWALSKESGGDLPFNGHENYFAGIALEIDKADYWGRLRVFDNYPLTWAKYHFFNGAISSFPFFFFAEKNLASFQISKTIIVLLLIFALIEQLDLRRTNVTGKTLALLATVLATQAFSHQLWWAFFTNNATSILLLLIFLQVLANGRSVPAVLFLAGFGISTARSAFPAAFLFFSLLAYEAWCIRRAATSAQEMQAVQERQQGFAMALMGTIRNWIAQLNIQQKVFFLTSIVGIAFMMISGVKTENPFRGRKILLDFLNDGWSSLISSSLDVPLKVGAFNPSLVIFFLWSLFVVWVAWVSDGARKMARASNFFAKIKTGRRSEKALVSAFVLMIFLFAVCFALKRPSYFLYYFLTIFLFYLSVPERISFAVRLASGAFLCASIIELALFSGQVSVPNFLIIEWMTWFFVFLQVINLRLEFLSLFNKMVVVSILTVAFAVLCVVPLPLSPLGLFQLDGRDENTITLPYVRGDPNADDYQRIEPVCELERPKMAALASLGGARAYFSEVKTLNTSVSITFLNKDAHVIQEIKDLCQARHGQ